MTNQQLIIWATIGVYLVFMLVIGLLSRKNTSAGSEMTVGKRNATAWLSALSYGTAYFSAVMFIGYSGKTGWGFWLYATLVGIGNAIFGSWLAWKVLARRTRDVSTRLHLKSMPQFLSNRYDSKAMKTFSAIVIFIFLTPYSASVYNGLSSVCAVVLNIDEMVCRILIALTSILLLVLGGYVATLKADFVQGIILMFGVALLIFFVIRSDKVGGFDGISTLWSKMKTDANGLRPLSSDNTITLVSTIIMTSFGTWGLPQMIHKYYTIKDDHEVKRGTVISTVFALLVAGGGYFIGSLSHAFSDTLPEGGVDYIVPHMLIQSQLPDILLGVVLMLLISASVSTLSAITLTACTTMSMDIVKVRLKKQLSPKADTWTIRIFCIIFVILSFVISVTDTPIFDMMSYSWGIISGSFLAPYVLSLYWKRLGRRGAWAGLLTGFIVAIVPAVAKIACICGVNAKLFTALASKGAEFAVAAMLLSLAVCFVCGLLSKDTDDEQKRVKEFFYNGTVNSSAEQMV